MEFMLTLCGVLLVIEGIPWFLSPQGTKRLLLQVLTLTDGSLRWAGLTAMVLGLLLVRLAYG